jgi:hypothetical protein
MGLLARREAGLGRNSAGSIASMMVKERLNNARFRIEQIDVYRPR